MPSFDDDGWLVGALEPMPVSAAHALLASNPSSRVDVPRWRGHAKRFFAADLTVMPDKRYAGEAFPRVDAFEVEITVREWAATVHAITFPIEQAPLVAVAAQAAVRAIGGAGFDVLLARAVRVWQVAVPPMSGDERGPLLFAAILASSLLAPILEAEGRAIYGVKGARERLIAGR